MSPLEQLHSGSAELRKIARAVSRAAKVVGTGVKAGRKGMGLAGKGLALAVKHPYLALPVLAAPGVAKKWQTAVRQASPYSEINVYPTEFWRRPQ
jgi:hypothetical protein